MNLVFFDSRNCLTHDEKVRLGAINLSCKENYLLTFKESRINTKKQPIFNINMEKSFFFISN